VAGVAACVAYLGVDVVSVRAQGYALVDSPCHVVYTNDAFLHDAFLHDPKTFAFELGTKTRLRHPRTNVSLLHPEESVSVFPLSKHGHNQCRQAWLAGSRAASYVGIGIVLLERDAGTGGGEGDVMYAFADLGTEPGRASDMYPFGLATEYAVAVNEEVLSELDSCLQDEKFDVIEWLHKREDHRQSMDMEEELSFDSGSKTLAHSILQSFFLGYYYSIFLRITDTRSLELQVVEGAWRFQSYEFLHSMRVQLLKSRQSRQTDKRSSGTIARQTIIEILSQLFLGHNMKIANIEYTNEHRESWCLGVVQNRTLAVHSLINPCTSPSDIGRFVLLDVDVSGIPRDVDGVIRPGVPSLCDVDFLCDDSSSVNFIQPSLSETTPVEDISLHIEADWDSNPDTTLLCIRYRGRRITTLSPASTDTLFIKCWIPPIDNPSPAPLTNALSYDLFETLSQQNEPAVRMSDLIDTPTLVQVQGRPRMRYAAVALCNAAQGGPFLASNCVHQALSSAKAYQARTIRSRNVLASLLNKIPIVIIASQGRNLRLDHVHVGAGEPRICLIGNI
jgi:hypothetical protein